MKMNKKGFTLIEMLVVIAIIAILVAIVVPTVSTATEKAKEAKDAANIRSAIASVTTEGLSTGEDVETTVELSQSGTFDNEDLTDIAGYDLNDFANAEAIKVSFTAETGEVSLTAVAGDVDPTDPTT